MNNSVSFIVAEALLFVPSNENNVDFFKYCQNKFDGFFAQAMTVDC